MSITFNGEETGNHQDVLREEINTNTDPLYRDEIPSVNLNNEETLERNQFPVTNNPMKINHRLVDGATSSKGSVTVMNIMNDIEGNLGPILDYAEEPLLPLYKACASLENIIDDLSTYIKMALDETPEKPFDELTIDESAAIRLYTLEWKKPYESLYTMLNRTLKDESREKLRPYFKYLKLLLTAIVKLPCIPPLSVWRGVTKNLSTQFPPGTTVVWWGFSSCTTEMTVLENNMYLGNTGSRTLFSVEAINARTIRNHSHFVNEDEVLLLPGTQMIVQSQFSPASDLYIIHLKQVRPEQILLEPPFEGAYVYPKIQRQWYRKKRFAIPIGFLFTLIIGGIIIGSVLGTRPRIHTAASVCTHPFQAPTTYATGNNPQAAALGHFMTNNELVVAVVNSGDNALLLLSVNADGTLQNPRSYPIGYRPSSSVAADFNNDNKLDFAVSHYGDDTIRIILGNENGIFQNSINYVAGNRPVSLVAKDFNNDNKIDLVVANFGTGTVSIMFNKGNGMFQYPVNYPIGRRPSSLVVNDFNNDNKLDLAISNYDDSNVIILFGEENSTFGIPISYPVNGSTSSIVCGDFNNDNQPDLVVTSANDNIISVLLGNKNRTFQPYINSATDKIPFSIIAGDFNNDTKLDVAVVNTQDNSTSVLLGIGNGSFQTPTTYIVGYLPVSVILGDFNDDTKLD
ncbi:unnamed protein product, partial [Adineta steineri]